MEIPIAFFRSSLLGVDINRAWNMPVGGFIQELKSLKEEVNKINEASLRLEYNADIIWISDAIQCPPGKLG